MTIESPPPTRRLPGLDWIRGIASLWVWAYHLDITLQKAKYFGHPALSAFTSVGYRGVDLFFVLSGFVMARVYRRDDVHPARAARRFLGRRLFRIFPAYLVVFLPLFAAAVLAHVGGPVSVPLDGALFLRDLLLLPRDDLTTFVPVSAWTLTHELMFYLLFTVAFFSHRVFAMLLAAWAVVCLCWGSSNAVPAGWAMPLSPLNAYFLCGYACAQLPALAGRLKWLCGAVCVALLALAVVGESRFAGGEGVSRGALPWMVNAAYAAAFFLVVYALSAAPDMRWKPAGRCLDYFGRLSYGIYLVNYPIVVACAMIARHLPGQGMPVLLVGSTSLLATVLVADLLNRAVERPGIERGQRIFR